MKDWDRQAEFDEGLEQGIDCERDRILNLIDGIFNKKAIEKVVDLMVKKGIPKEFIFNEKHFYRALELIEEELKQKITSEKVEDAK